MDRTGTADDAFGPRTTTTITIEGGGNSGDNMEDTNKMVVLSYDASDNAFEKHNSSMQSGPNWASGTGFSNNSSSNNNVNGEDGEGNLGDSGSPYGVDPSGGDFESELEMEQRLKEANATCETDPHLAALTPEQRLLYKEQQVGFVFKSTKEWSFSLIRPYNPSLRLNNIATAEIMTDEILSEKELFGTSYKHPLLKEEFRRFQGRDFTLVAIAAAYFGGAVGFPNLTHEMREYATSCWVTAAILAFCFSADVACHVALRNTPQSARVRQVAQCFTMMCCTVLTMFNAWLGWYQDCNNGYIPDWLISLGLPRPEFNDFDYYVDCVWALNPFGVVTVTVVAMSLTLPPLAIIALIGHNYLWFLLARLIIPHTDEPNEYIAIKLVMLTMASVIGFILYVNKYRGAMHQFEQAVKVVRETLIAKKREDEVDDLLVQMIPSDALLRLSQAQEVKDYTEEATVLFSDMVQFTAWSSKRTAHQVVEMLNNLCQQFDAQATKRKIEKVKTIGDAYWAVTGLPEYLRDHAERMIDFANMMHTLVDQANKRNPHWDNVRLRIGINSGNLSGGILGSQSISYEVFGHTSHIAEEVEKNGVPSRVTISESTAQFAELIPEMAANTKTMTVDGETFKLLVMKRETVAKMKAHYERKVAQEQAKAERAGFAPRGGGRDGSKTPSGSDIGGFLFAGNSRRQETGSQLSGNLQSKSSFSQSRRSGSQMSVLPAAEAKARRQEFLAKKAAATNGGKKEETLDELMERYSKRKYNWLLFGFADEEIETEYITFVQKTGSGMRKLSRICSFGSIWILMIIMWGQGAQWTAGSITCMLIANLLAVLDLLLNFADKLPATMVPTLQGINRLIFVSAALQHLLLCLVIVSFGLMHAGQATPSNSIAYTHSLFGLLAATGSAGLVPTAVLVVAHMSTLELLVIVFSYNEINFKSGIIFYNLAFLIIAFLIILLEKKFRKQFLETRVAQHFEEKQLAKNREQEALLATIVPNHVINELMIWLSDGMQLQKSIVKTFPHAVVCFIRLSPNKAMMKKILKERVEKKTKRLLSGASGNTTPRAGTGALADPNEAQFGKSYNDIPPNITPNFSEGGVALEHQNTQDSMNGQEFPLAAEPVGGVHQPPGLAPLLVNTSGGMGAGQNTTTNLNISTQSAPMLEETMPFDRNDQSPRPHQVTISENGGGISKEGSADTAGSKSAGGGVSPESGMKPKDSGSSSAAPSKHKSSHSIARKPSHMGARRPSQKSVTTSPSTHAGPLSVLNIQTSSDVTFDPGQLSSKSFEASRDASSTYEEFEDNQDSQGGLDWMAPTHAAVDDVIVQFPAIEKIKTIGDLVMLAGPFNENYGVGQAADQTVGALAMISEVADLAAGMHVGEIVGAVLGTNRLCFDVFGDTVNTSSRSLSTGGPTDVSLSEEFYTRYKYFHTHKGDPTGDADTLSSSTDDGTGAAATTTSNNTKRSSKTGGASTRTPPLAPLPRPPGGDGPAGPSLIPSPTHPPGRIASESGGESEKPTVTQAQEGSFEAQETKEGEDANGGGEETAEVTQEPSSAFSAMQSEMNHSSAFSAMTGVASPKKDGGNGAVHINSNKSFHSGPPARPLNKRKSSAKYVIDPRHKNDAHRYCVHTKFSDPLERQAKGKGTISVRVIKKWPTVDFPASLGMSCEDILQTVQRKSNLIDLDGDDE